MSINDLADELDILALQAALKAKAVEPCYFHKHVLIHRGNDDADRHAYALATNAWKDDGRIFEQREVTEAVKDVFVQAADGSCPACDELRDA